MCMAYFSSFQNSASPFLTGEVFTGGLAVPGLFIDDRAISSSSSSSVAFGLARVGLTGGASFFCGVSGGLDVPGLMESFVAMTGFFADAVQPQAGQMPLKFNASPHSLHSGIG